VANDLTADRDTNAADDVFVRDLQMGTTTLVSVNRSGTGSGNQDSGIYSAISADGRFVAFMSNASDLTANDTNGTQDVFVRDLQMGRTTLVSVNRFGTGSGNRFSELPTISADGRFVAFESYASDLAANDNNGPPPFGPLKGLDVFVRDLQMGTTTLMSINRSGTGSGNDYSRLAVISPNGRLVVFQSNATDLVTTDDANGQPDLFVRPVAP